MSTSPGQAPAPPAEDVPSGRFGGPRIALPDHITPCTPAEQAAHLRELSEALSTFRVADAMHRHRTPGKERSAP